MPSPFWTLHAARRPFLMGRVRIAAALRQFFAAQDFVEVDTAALVLSPGNEAHLHAFATELVAPAATPTRFYLRTSPEFACKKLLAGGETRIFDFAKVFRNRERGERGGECERRRIAVHAVRMEPARGNRDGSNGWDDGDRCMWTGEEQRGHRPCGDDRAAGFPAARGIWWRQPIPRRCASR